MDKSFGQPGASDEEVTFLHIVNHPSKQDEAVALIEAGAPVDARTWNMRTPLIIAAEHNHVKVIKALVAKGAALDAQDEKGHTAIELAAYRNRADIVGFLLEHGASPDVPNIYGNDARFWSVHNEQPEITQMIDDFLSKRSGECFLKGLSQPLKTGAALRFNEKAGRQMPGIGIMSPFKLKAKAGFSWAFA